MRRIWLLPLIVTACLGAGRQADASDRGPVCRLPSVVDEMTLEVHDHNYYSKVDPKLITETPTADPMTIRCQVCVLSAPYDMTRFSEHPVRQCVEHRFDVQILHNGFVIHDLK